MSLYNKPHYLILILIGFLPIILQAQDSTMLKAEPIKIKDTLINQARWATYDKDHIAQKLATKDNSYLAKKTYLKQSQVKNATPEQLFESIQSTTNQEWVNYNTYGGEESASKKKPEFFQRIETMDKNTNYFELQAKLYFIHEGQDYAFVKFRVHLDKYPNKSIAGCYLIIKENGRWYHHRTSKLNGRIKFVLANMKPEVLTKIFRQEKTDIKIHNELLKKITIGNEIDLEKLVEEYYTWTEKERPEACNYFLDPLNW